MERGKNIVIEGPIGVGKTSLVNLLAKKFSARRVLEAAEENPFLRSFYSDQKRYAFQTQLFFLLSRYRQQMELAQQDLFEQSVVCDYLFDRDKIFAYLNLDDTEGKGLRAADLPPVHRGAQPGEQLLLLPLLRDSTAGDQHQRHRFRQEPGRPGRPGQPDTQRQEGHGVLHAPAVGEGIGRPFRWTP